MNKCESDGYLRGLPSSLNPSPPTKPTAQQSKNKIIHHSQSNQWLGALAPKQTKNIKAYGI